MTAPYHYVWPGQPGGYVCTAADKVIADRPKKKPPKPTQNTGMNASIWGISPAADEAARAYQRRGAAMRGEAPGKGEGRGKAAATPATAASSTPRTTPARAGSTRGRSRI